MNSSLFLPFSPSSFFFLFFRNKSSDPKREIRKTRRERLLTKRTSEQKNPSRNQKVITKARGRGRELEKQREKLPLSFFLPPPLFLSLHHRNECHPKLVFQLWIDTTLLYANQARQRAE